jgi:hypothetical protein
VVAQDGIVGSSAIGDWSKAFGEFHRQIGHRFRRSEARERVRRYLLGLLGRIERKNGTRTFPYSFLARTVRLGRLHTLEPTPTEELRRCVSYG